jgi:hypothetical protein
MTIGISIDIGILWLPTQYFSKILFMQGFMMDRNFQAEHMKMRNPENDIPLSEGGDSSSVENLMNYICTQHLRGGK